MKKFMKFTMFEKDSKDTKYRDDPYRAVIFRLMKAVLRFARMGKNSTTFTAERFAETSMAGPRSFSNAKTAAGVRSRTNAANARATELSV